MKKNSFRKICIISLLSLAFASIVGGVSMAATNDPLDPDYVDPLGAVDDSDQKGCTKGSSSWSWFPCTMNKFISGASRNIFEQSESFIRTDPEIFKNNALKLGWKTARNLANLVVVVMLIITIMSQISGFGISNYGVKKALPRIVVVAVLINLSYLICQIAIDVMNISGEAIRNAFDPLIDSAWAKVHYDPGVFASLAGGTTTTALSLILAYFGTKTFLASGESIMLLAIFLLITILVGVMLLIAVIVVRAALVVLLTITSPLAVVLAVFPGTKKSFNRWFDLFKGVLLCYPMTSLMVYGGNFAAVIAMAALGLNSITIAGIDIPVNVFTLMVSAAAAIAPIIALPGMVIKSTGAIGATMQNFARNITGGLKGMVGGSAFGERLRRNAMDKRNQWVAGVDKDGNKKTGVFANMMKSRSADERMAAEQALAGSRAKERSEIWTQEHEDEDSSAMDEAAKDYEQELRDGSVGLDDASMSRVFDQIFADPDNVDVSKVEGAMSYFTGLNPKCGAEDYLLKRMDKVSDPALRQKIARQRLRSDGDTMLKKTPIEYAYYTAVANGETGSYYDASGKRPDDKWIEAAVNGSVHANGSPNGIDIPTRFNGIAMSNYAGPTLNYLGEYMKGKPASDPATQRIRLAYDQMIRTASYRQNAAKGDFDKIKKAIEGS